MPRFDPNFRGPGFPGPSNVLGTFYNAWGYPDGEHSWNMNWRDGAMPISNSNRRAPDGKYRSGYTWLMWKRTYGASPSQTVTTRNSGGTGKISYIGKFHLGNESWNENPAIKYGRFPDGRATDDGASLLRELEARGAEAYNRMRPDKPDFSIIQEILELKDVFGMVKNATKDIQNLMRKRNPPPPGGPPSGSGSKKPLRPSDVAEFHLALQFGWAPIVRSMLSAIKVHQNQQKRLSQLIRDEGRSIRRRTELHVDPGSSHVETVKLTPTQRVLAPNLYYMSYHYGDKPWYRTTRTWHKTRAWAVARFRYLLPPGPRDVNWTKRMNRRLWGAYVTPSTVWNIMPWSWLADYFVSAGDFLEATSGGVTDCLIMEYCYLMMEQTQYYETEQNQWVLLDAGGDYQFTPGEVKATDWSTVTIKCRIRGSPFGWGVKQSDLSAHQLGILGALGLSRI